MTQSIPNGAWTPLAWNTVEDPYGSWAAGSPTRFKPTFAGNFLLNGGVAFLSTAPATYAQATSYRAAIWYRTGAMLSTLTVIPNPAGIALSVAARPYLVYLNGTTDYIELSASHDVAPAINTSVAAGYASSITVTYAGP